MKKRIIELSVDNRKEYIQLVVNPQTLEFDDPQNNQQITLLDVGSANLLGDKGLTAVSLQSFFPNTNSPFYARYGGMRSPEECKNLVKKWKDNKMIVRLIISDMDVNLAMTIDDFKYSKKEGDDDLYYTITMTEYRTLNVPTVKVSTQIKSTITKRPATSSNASSASSQANTSGRTYTIKSGDTLWAIAKRYYGSGTQYPKIYNANKSTIESVAKKHGKKSSDNGHWIWAGTTLTIP